MPSDLRRVHRSLVLRNVFAGPGRSRTQLATETGLSAMAITRITRELIDAGLIDEMGKRDRKGKSGRRQTDLEIRADGAYVVGLVISAFGHEIALMNAKGTPLIRRKLTFDDFRSADEAVEMASQSVRDLVGAADIDETRFLGVGIAIAGFVQSATGTVLQAPYLGWKEVDLAREISARIGAPVVAENIADAINMAEQTTGTVTAAQDVFLVHISVTCGASYAHKGEVIPGANFSAGQIGHLPVGGSDLICSCGSRDCLNNHASGWSTLVGLGRIESRQFNAEEIEIYADAMTSVFKDDPKRGTPEGDALFKSGQALGHALRSVALIADPHAVVLAGRLADTTAYVDGCRDVWAKLRTQHAVALPDLIVGEVAPLQAAGHLALNRFLYSPQLDIEALAGSSEVTASATAS